MPVIRPAAVAGAFYPGDAAALAEEVRRHLRSAPGARGEARAPKAVPYTHPTLPTSALVEVSVVPASLKNKQY